MKTALIIFAILVIIRIVTKPKTRLLSYKMHTFQALNSDCTTIDMELERTRVFGLIKYNVESTYDIPDGQSLKKHFDHWDKLIETKKPLK